MQACARIGATHSVVFGGFSAKSLQERIIDAGAVAVITADEQVRGGKQLPLKAIVDEALGMGGCEAVRKRHRLQAHRRQGRLASPRATCGCTSWSPSRPTPASRSGSAPSIRCSSSTRRARPASPRACSTATGGYLLWAMLTMQWMFDIKPTDIFWCTADIGWVTGHTYIAYGPLAVGATEIVFEGVPTYPDAGPLLADDPEAQGHDLLHRADGDPLADQGVGYVPQNAPKNYDLSSLRLLGTVGEPINPEAWMWYHENVGGGRCPIVDTWWQTETGGHMITPLPGVTPLVPGSCTLPLPGIIAAIVDETGHDVPNGQGGILVIKRPWPSMIRTIWGDPERYQEVATTRRSSAASSTSPATARCATRRPATSRSWAASTTC